jgi:hypothetical protein
MTPEDLAKLHPFLYHATDPVNLDGILNHGLLSTRCVLSLHGFSDSKRDAFVRRRRPESESITRGQHVAAVITDNKPLVESKLKSRLNDNLTLEDWCEKLNERVFFFPHEQGLQAFLNARPYRHLDRQVLVFNTRRLAEAYAEHMELSPINSGAALFVPAARRGHGTFTPLLLHSYKEWRKLRRDKGEIESLDDIKEITVVGGITNVRDFLEDHYVKAGGG